MLYAGATDAVAMTVLGIQPEGARFESLVERLFLRLNSVLGGGHVSPSWL